MKNKILSMLKKADGYMSGEDISKQTGISRTAVWKNINKLKSEGYQIDSVTNKGYKIVFVPDLITDTEIKSILKTSFIGQNTVFYPETNSTSTQAKIHSDMPDGTVFVAEMQTAGKGRLGRAWTTKEGGGIWFSVLLKPALKPSGVPAVTLIAGLAVCRCIRKLGIDAMIKWPNDIVVDGKKICGILTEMSAEINRVNYIVCGIGINVNIESFEGELSDKATSVLIETGKSISRCVLLCDILHEFEKIYLKFLKFGFSVFKKEYRRLCVTLGKTVTVERGNSAETVYAADIGEDGSLIIEKDGKRSAVLSGEVSVRGIYGYV